MTEGRMWFLIITATIISATLLVVNGLIVWLYIQSNSRSIQLTAAVRQLQRDLARQALDFQEQLAHQAREYDLKLASEVEKWLDQRQRHWVTARSLIVARQWILKMFDVLKAAGLPIPVPDNADEIYVTDESIHRAEIERANEHELDDLIALARQEMEAVGPVDSPTTDTGAP